MPEPDVVISAEGVSKAYRIGRSVEHRGSVAGSALAMLSSPIRNFKALRSLDTSRAHLNGDGGKDDSGIIWAVRDVSFELRRGEVMGIVGRNGAGKSTLLKILSRVTEPTAGRVRIRGRVAALLEVGTGFNPELTGRENIYLNGTILGMSRREINRKFDEIVDFSGVSKFLDTPVKRYSSGMRVRLGFAVAAHLEPDILIVDEVLAVGDADFQRKCLGKLRDVATGEGRTVLLVSHNMASITTLAETCLFLESGRVRRFGPTNEIVELYMEQFVRHNDAKPGYFPTEPGPSEVAMLKSLEVMSQGKSTEAIRMGDDLVLRMTLDSAARPGCRPLTIGIGIETTTGVRVVSFGAMQAGFQIIPNGGEFSITCDLGRIPLNQGSYSIKVVLAEYEGKKLEVYENLGSLHVVPADVFGNGSIPSGPQGYIYWASQWNQETIAR